MDELTKSPARAPNVGVALVYTAALLQGLCLVAVPALSPVLKGTLRLTDAEYGAVFLPQVLATAIAALIGGLLTRRWSLQALLVGALAANGASQLALLGAPWVSAAHVFPLVFISCTALGLGFGLGAAPLNSLPGLLFSARKDSALVALHTLLGAGFCIGPLAAGWALSHGAWTIYPAALAVLSITIAVLALCLTLPRLVAVTATASRVRAPRTQASFWILVFIAVLYAFAEGTFSNWALPFLVEDRALSAAAAAFTLSAFWGGLVFGRLVVSAVIVRVSAVYVWSRLPLLIVAAFLIIPEITGARSSLLAFAFAGLACSAFFPLTVARATTLFPAHAALMSSIMTAALMLGVGLGTFSIAPLRAILGLTALYRYSALYPLVVLMLIGVLRLLQVKSARAAPIVSTVELKS
ncbi:MAG: MFS transporter [Gammaproteobacteria bacterium]|nr:MFS transporter [Gammaproteobacteria bacterium]